MKKSVALLALAAICLTGGPAMAGVPTYTVNIWPVPTVDVDNGTVSVDILMTELESLNALILYSSTRTRPETLTRYNEGSDSWEGTSDLTLVSLDLHPDLLGNFPLGAGGAWPTLADWTHEIRTDTTSGAISYTFYPDSQTRPDGAQTPPNPAYGSPNGSAIVTYTFEFDPGTEGLYNFALDSEWINISPSNDENSTRSSLGFGDEFSVVPVGRQEWYGAPFNVWVDSQILNFFDPSEDTTTGQFTLAGQVIIPEPATMLLLGSGLVGLVAMRRRK